MLRLPNVTWIWHRLPLSCQSKGKKSSLYFFCAASDRRSVLNSHVLKEALYLTVIKRQWMSTTTSASNHSLLQTEDKIFRRQKLDRLFLFQCNWQKTQEIFKNEWTAEPFKIMSAPLDVSPSSRGRPSRRPIKRARSRAVASHQRSWP